MRDVVCASFSFPALQGSYFQALPVAFGFQFEMHPLGSLLTAALSRGVVKLALTVSVLTFQFMQAYVFTYLNLNEIWTDKNDCEL